MPRSIITLTTDFGLSDHFVGTMKGVILGIHPEVELVDLSHEISPYSISEAAFVLSQAYSYFPKKTVHLVVVDPGVGTARRPLILEAAGQYFVAPDNGVLATVYSREAKHRVRAITNDVFFLKPVSNTFHGRDVFAPVAAHLARGAAPGRFGKPCSDYLKPAFEKPIRTGKRFWAGSVLKIDRFGNLITNFHISEFSVLQTRAFVLNAGGREVTELALTYAEQPEGEVFAIIGSSGYFEIVMNQGSAAKALGCAAGAPVELTLL